MHPINIMSAQRSMIFGLFAGLLLSACGNGASPDQTLDPKTKIEREAPTGQSEAGNRDGSAPTHIVNAFAFTVNKAATTNPTPEAGDIQLSGGCAGEQPLSMGFYRDRPGMGGYFYLSFDSVEPVTSKQTGAIELAKILWDDGAVTPANLPADSGVLVPNRYAGTGTLTINLHTGMGHAGRMSGKVEGDLKHPSSGKTATVSATFDVNLACGK